MIDNMCHRKRNDYKIDMAIDTFWHESIVHKIGKVLLNDLNINQISDQRFFNQKIAPGKAHKMAIPKPHRTTR